jgi:predicted AlkP superfamily phosphohydrolase/phosphomutase
MNFTETSETRQRVMIIGLDGATFDLIKPWVAEGRLPTFKRLMQDSSWGELQVDLPPGTVPNWPSFATGKNPGKHGLIWWVKRDRLTKDFSVVSSADFRGQTIWDIAGQNGLQVGVVNVPVTYPPQPVNGFLISGLLTPPTAKIFAFPEDLPTELKENVGEYRIFPTEMYQKGNEGAFLDDLHLTLERRYQAVNYLLQNKSWDLFTVVFGATDWVMHAYWKYHDPGHPRYNPEEGKLYGHAIKSIYEHLDKILAGIFELVDDNTTVIIMSDHGAGPGVAKSMINNWLLNNKLLSLKRTPISQIKYLLFRLGFTPENVYPLVTHLKLLNARLKRTIDPRRKGRKSPLRKIFLSYNDVDWSRTKAFTFGGMGQIYINSKGPDGQGCVSPGEEYNQIRELLIERIKDIKLPNSDQHFVERVYLREDLYHGEYADQMPDLVLFPSDMRYLDSGMEFFSNKLFSNLDANSGAHRTNGIFMINGPNTKKRQDLENVNIKDIAPTALYLLNLPVPDDIDGRIITESLRDNYIKCHPFQITSVSDTDEANEKESYASTDDEDLIRQRLANLGYLD